MNSRHGLFSTKNRRMRLIALLLTLLLMVELLPVSAFGTSADVNRTPLEENTVVLDTENVSNKTDENLVSGEEDADWHVKISEAVWKGLESAENNEKMPVWIWFSDIDQQEIDKQVEEVTNLSIDSLLTSYAPVPDELRAALGEELEKTENDGQRGPVERTLKDYINETSAQREVEYQQTKAYIRARRNTAIEAYKAKNEALIKELALPEDEIVFQSQLTPSVIVNLTRDQLQTVAKSANVVSVEFYDDTNYAPPYYPNQKETMRVNMAYDYTGLTGNGINVLMLDHGLVRSDADYYNRVNPANIRVVYNEALYSLDELYVYEDTYFHYHPNLVAGAMQYYASDVNIFSASKFILSDVEWAIANLDIQLVNGSVNMGSSSTYLADAYAKWFDAIVSTYDLTLIASAGNSESWQSSGWPNVISPSSGYNSIAAGAYRAGTNNIVESMYNYRYNPISGSNLVNYKPDLVVAAPSTSEASPALSGIVAMMLELKPSLAAYPELIKAILMASCHRKITPFNGTSQETMEDGLTQRQGAGAVDAFRAISIVVLGNYGVRNIATGYTDINIGQLGAAGNNVNVSIAWLRENTCTLNNNRTSTLGTLQELELSILSGNDTIGTSAKQNAGKQLVYFTSRPSDHTIRVTKTSQNTEPVRYAYAWSLENSTFDQVYDISVSVTDLEYDNSEFTYNTILFSDSMGFYHNKPLYVTIIKYSNTGAELDSETYTVTMNTSAHGYLTSIEQSVNSFAENEYLEVIVYRDSATQNLLSRQVVSPVIFEF